MLTLSSLHEALQACHRCALRDTAHGVVFGEGVPKPVLVCVGEAPGAKEDELLRPFVGRSGILLDQMLVEIGFSRAKNTFILNAVKCRPPQNRRPTARERLTCSTHLQQQLDLLQPKLILLLGQTAVTATLNTNEPLNVLRRRIISKNGFHYLVTYHPAYVLRKPSAKYNVQQDLHLAKHFLDNQPTLVDKNLTTS